MDDFRSFLAGHYGVFTRSEALELGVTDDILKRLLRNGEVVRTFPQTYRSTTNPRTWDSRARGAAASAQGVLSHRAAAAVWGIDTFPRALIEVTIPNARSVVIPGVKIRRSKRFDLVDATAIDGHQVTGIGRTVLDLAAVISERRLNHAIDAVIRSKLLDWPDLYHTLTLHSRRGRNGCGYLRKVLDVRYGETTIPDSAWNRNVQSLLFDAGLPLASFEHEVVDSAGRFIARVDLAYPRKKIAIELDSVRWHLNRKSFEQDPRRKNRLIVEGWTVLTFTWSDYVDDPAGLVETVRRALAVL